MATYELSAFTEQELLDAGQGNGSNLGVGDNFTMPAETNAVITVTDNDGYLSGDSRRNENANDWSGQTASITVDGVTTGGTGQIYAEQFFWVCDEAGNWYIMLEIEQEDSSGDYFVFYDYCGLPEEGAELSVVCARNITHCWEPRYDDMMQEPPFAPPIALNDMISITEDQSIGDAAADAQLNVLANDFDIDSAFTLSAVTNGVVGEAFDVTTSGGVVVSVTIAADGTLTFDAAGQFDALNVGESDSFVIEYTISDENGGSASADVTVTINGTVDGPVATADSFTTTESGTITGNILTNDEGNDAGDLSVVSIEANGETYQPGDSFTVTTDGGRTGTVTVEADGSLTFTTDGNFDDLTTNQTDTVTLSYTAAGANLGDNLIINGDFETHGELTRGSGENRWDVFDSLDGWTTPTGQLEVQQGSHGGTPQNSTTNSVIELDSHDAGDTNAAISQTVSIGEDGSYALSFDYSPRQLGNLIGETSGISVIVDGEVIASFSSDTLGYDNYSFSLDLDAGDHTIGFSGHGVDDTFGALLDNVELREALTDTAEVTLTIVGENEGPVAENDGFAVTEANGGFDVITGDVLANDTDADGDALTVTGVNGDQASVGQVIDVVSDVNGFAATVTIAADGTITLDASDEFAAMTTGESDTVSVTYTISDGAGGTSSATATLTVNGSNEGPVADDDGFTVTEANGSFDVVSGDVLANDTDADGDTITVTGIDGDTGAVGQVLNVVSDTNGFAATVTIAADGTITLDASDEFAAMTTGESDTVTISYTIGDGAGGSDTATATLTVNGSNEGPVAADDSFSVTEADASFADVTGNVLTNDTDADGDTLTVTGVEGDAALVGQTINVVSDVNGFAATVSIAADGTVTLSASDEFAALSDDQTDTVTVSYEISDGEGGVDTATVVLDVNGINAAPIAVDDEFETFEMATFETTVGNLLTNDSDPDGDTFTITAIEGEAGNVGQVIELETDDLGLPVSALILPDGTIELTPGSDVNAELSEGESDFVEFSYEITDANGATSEAFVTFVINGANIDPDAQDAAFTTAEQADGSTPEVTGNLLDTATDADGDTISISAINGDASAVGDEIVLTSADNGFDVSVVVDANGDVTLSPGQAFAELDEGEEDTVTFTYDVIDGNGGTDTATVTLTVTGIEGNGGGGGGGGQGNVSYNVVFIVDTSGAATQTTFGGDENEFFEVLPADQQNLNGDATNGSHADAELYTVQQISDQLASLNLSDDIDVGVYTSNLDTTGGAPFSGALGLTNSDGGVTFDAGQDLTNIFLGTDGNGPLIYNSAISGANDFFVEATTGTNVDQYDTTVNLVYVLSSSTGIDFNPAVLSDADANLAGELSQMDANFDFTIDTIFFDQTIPDLPLQLDTLEAFGDGVTNVVNTASDLADVLNGVDDTVTDALNAATTLVNTVIETPTTVIEDLLA